MSKSKHTFSKKERAKNRKQKKDGKLQARLERSKDKKIAKEKGHSPGELENMLARVDHFGNVIPESGHDQFDDETGDDNGDRKPQVP